MLTTKLLLSAVTVAALAASAVPAHAAETEYIDRSAFDFSVQKTASSIRVDGATRGPLGGYLDVTVTADDGTLPVGSNVCEPATFDAVLTVSPGETLSTSAAGEICTTFYGDALTANAYFAKKDLDYAGTEHNKAKVVGDGLIAVGTGWLGGQASFAASVKW
jgi:hypothetical protein